MKTQSEAFMSEIKPHYKMSLDRAVEIRMNDEAWEAYLSFHQVSITRRDD